MSDSLPAALAPVGASAYPRRPRLLFLLKRRPEVDQDQFEKALERCRRQFPAAVAADSVIVRAAAALQAEQQFICEMFGGAPVALIDGYVTVDLESYDPAPADFERLFSIATTCLAPLADVIDHSGTVAYAGVANLAIPGYAPLSMVLILDKADHLTLEQYHSWWVRHGDDHRRTFPDQAGYHQLHSAPEYSARAAEAAGVSTSDQCIIDMMYLGSRQAATGPGNPDQQDADRISAEIGSHVGFGNVRGSLFREL